MKSYRILTLLISLILSSTSIAQYVQSDGSETCYDITCFYRMREEGLKIDRQEQQQQLESYRNQLLEAQAAQLEETRRQNAFIEQQLQQIDQRQQQLEESQMQVEKQLEEQRLKQEEEKEEQTEARAPDSKTETE